MYLKYMFLKSRNIQNIRVVAKNIGLPFIIKRIILLLNIK